MGHNMKSTILYALLGIFFFSCSSSIDDGTGLAVLQRADSLMRCHPDSSLSLLRNIKEPDTLSKADRAYYALLLTQARDKNYIKHSTDSLIRVAVDYYDSKGDIVLQMKSHYYLARVYQDMDSISATMREFMIAGQCAEERNDSDFICLSSANLGYLLKQHDLLNEADSFYRQAEKIAVLNNDSLHLAMILINRADICIMIR